MYMVSEYDTKNYNCIDYEISSHEAPIDLGQEIFEYEKIEEVTSFDACNMLGFM